MVRTFDVPESARKALGKKVWWPDSIPKSRRIDGRPRYNPLYVFFLLTFVVVTGNLFLFDAIVYRDSSFIWGFLFAAGALAYCFRTMQRHVRMPILAVHEHGVLVPQTATILPGMRKVGGPAVLFVSEIRGATRIADGETLAVLIRTASGQTGLVDNGQREQGLTSDEWRAIVDPFCAALAQVGVSVKRGSMADVGPDRGSEEE